VAASLKGSGADVEVIVGERGEFTVLSDGREAIRKGNSLPDVAAIRNALASSAALASS
jgi:hypothetical protein